MCGKIYFEGRPEMLLNIIPSVILPYHLCVKNNFDYMNTTERPGTGEVNTC